MTDLRQAAQQALEALIDAANVLSAPMFADAVAALRTALEQPEQEPICYASINKRGDVCSTLTQRDSWRTVPLYTTPPQQQSEPPEWLLIKNILDEYGLQALDFVAEFKAAQQVATIWKQPKQQTPFSPEAINTTQTAWRMGYEAAKAEQQAEPVSMRMPKVGDKVICLEDESLGEVVSLTAGGSPDIVFDDGSRGTYLLREFAELFGYAEQRQQQAEPVAYFDFQEHKFSWAKHMKISPVPVSVKVEPMKLYSESTKRQWVGLTNEEIEAVVEQVANGKLVGTVQEFRVRFSRAIESKLKEKNT